MDSTGIGASSLISISEDGVYAAQLNGKDLIVHLNPTSSEFKEVDILKVKENLSRFLRFSRAGDDGGVSSPGRHMLCASDTRIMIWHLSPLQQRAEIESVEPGALNVDFGRDENEIIVFHAWNTKLSIFSLDTGRSQVIKTPKSSHHNSFGYRPKTCQFAILLKPDTNDLLTIHEFRSYELIGRAVLPTVDAQGLKWSPDGKWIAVWDAASTGTKVFIFTADGQPFRTYTGPSESDSSLDLGIRGIEWSPVDRSTGTSEYLAVGKIDGSIDLLRSRTFTCSLSLTHITQIEQYSPTIWRERYTNTEYDLEYAGTPTHSASAMVPEPSGPQRGVSIMTFSPENGNLLATVDQTRSNIVWIWTLEPTPGILSALVHEHPVRQVVWHPSMTSLLITTVNSAVAVAHYWSPETHPVVVRIPVSRSESGKYDVRWLSSGQDGDLRFWFGTPEDYVLGYIEDLRGLRQFRVFYTVHSKFPTGSRGASMGRESLDDDWFY